MGRVSRVSVINGAPSLQNGATVTGSGGVLGDGSDGTFVALPGGTAGQAFVAHEGIADWMPEGKQQLSMAVLLRTSYSAANLPLVNVTQGAYGNWAGFISTLDHPSSTDAGGGWQRVPLPVFDPSGWGFLNTSTVNFNNVNTSAAGSIYEARLEVSWLIAGAPPCRNIKRGDSLDLGGARNYPPSKMQQTSSRGVGAY